MEVAEIEKEEEGLFTTEQMWSREVEQRDAEIWVWECLAFARIM